MPSFKWFDKLPRLHDDIETPDFFTDTDTETEPNIPTGLDNSGVLSDLFIYIDYTNSGGVSSRRPITIKREAEGSNAGFFAWCHKRKSLRQFRFDRISAVITIDGEVFEPAATFWHSIGYYPASNIREQKTPADDRHAATWAKRKFNHELVVLAALSGSDGNMHGRELDEIVDYIERELEWERLALEPVEITALRNHLRRMRITRERVEDSINELLHGEGRHRLYARQLDRFLSVARRVIDADGIYHVAEHEFLSYLAEHVNS